MRNKNDLKFYAGAKFVLGPILRFFMHLKPHGVENVPLDRGIILCSNHIAAVDVISIGAVCPRQLTFVAKKELFSVPVIGWLVKKLGAIKVDRGGNDIGAIKASVNAAKDGKVLSIFPQGTRCPGVDPKTTPLHNGAALIAFQSKCDVVPVCLKIKNGKYAFLRRVDVIFGKPIPYSDFGFENGGKEEYTRATQRIFSEITSMADYSYLPAYDPQKAKKKRRKKRK